ncbi:MAG: DUF3021 family protein [Acutalibacteraceae bacterium]|nr:DUF3021 family protein [Acutalibacteraceae bacterium]
MKNKIKELIIFILTGIGMGICTTLICMSLLGEYNETVKEIIIWTVASGCIGALTYCYTNLNINFLLSTILHCIGSFIVAVTASALCGYGNGLLSVILSIAPVFLIVYIVLYIIGFAIMKSEVKKVNEELNKKA